MPDRAELLGLGDTRFGQEAQGERRTHSQTPMVWFLQDETVGQVTRLHII